MAAAVKPHVFAEDMSEDDINKILEYAQEVFLTPAPTKTQFPHFAQQIRAMADKEIGPGWCCVVGQHYGAFVTHACVAGPLPPGRPAGGEKESAAAAQGAVSRRVVTLCSFHPHPRALPAQD